MPRGRPVFTAGPDPSEISRSTSSDRDSSDSESHIIPPPPRRRGDSFSAIHIPPNVYEEEDRQPSESDPFLADSYVSVDGDHRGSFSTPRPRKPTITRGPSLYGSFNDFGAGSPKFLQLNGGAPLARNQSIFKLSGMIDNKGGAYEKYRKSEEEMKGMKRNVREFYESQNEILDGFAEVDEILENTRASDMTGELAPVLPVKSPGGREEIHQAKVKLAVDINFGINFVLLFAKLAIVFLTSSMSLVASTVDSAMDFLSTIIIWGTSRIIDHKDWKSTYNYPTGKRRMEPMGVVVFSVFMIASFLQVFIESARRLIEPNLEIAVIPLIGKLVMGSTILVKLVVWVWCRSIKNSSVEALAQDAENDIVFNFFSLLFPFIGEQIGWAYLDPLGGVLLSVYIMVEWTQTLLDTIVKLTGKRASPQEHQRVAYLLVRFSPLIKCIQHLSVYHTGDSFVVETDVVLPRNTDLTIAHNVAESAQYGLEQLDRVERAFVHVDITVNDLSGHVPR